MLGLEYCRGKLVVERYERRKLRSNVVGKESRNLLVHQLLEQKQQV